MSSNAFSDLISQSECRSNWHWKYFANSLSLLFIQKLSRRTPGKDALWSHMFTWDQGLKYQRPESSEQVRGPGELLLQSTWGLGVFYEPFLLSTVRAAISNSCMFIAQQWTALSLLWNTLRYIFECLFSPSMDTGVIYTLQREAWHVSLCEWGLGFIVSLALK